MSTEPTPKRARARTPTNTTTTGVRSSDERWAVLELLPPLHVNTHRFGGGRPRMSDRRCANAIFRCAPYRLSVGGVARDGPVRHIHGV